jgi:hypothetical protein
MQKLKGISSGQNNKSCSIIHNGSSKIGLAFFCFFCDFLRNLQESAHLFNYWSYLFAIKTLERLLSLQCGPWGGRPARAAQFQRGRRDSWPGKGRRRVLGLQGCDLGAWLVGRSGRRGRAAAAGGGRRWSGCSGAVGGSVGLVSGTASYGRDR